MATRPVDTATDKPNYEMPTQTDEALDGAPTPHVPCVPTPDGNGNYACDMCHQKVRVGSRGAKNFLQHRGLPGCLKAAEKSKKALAKSNQVRKDVITSFFPQVTSRVSQSTTVSAACALNPPFTSGSPLLCSDLPHRPSVETAHSVMKQTSTCHDAHVMVLLSKLDHVAQTLPLQIPEAEEKDNNACVLTGGGPDDSGEA